MPALKRSPSEAGRQRLGAVEKSPAFRLYQYLSSPRPWFAYLCAIRSKQPFAAHAYRARYYAGDQLDEGMGAHAYDEHRGAHPLAGTLRGAKSAWVHSFFVVCN